MENIPQEQNTPAGGQDSNKTKAKKQVVGFMLFEAGMEFALLIAVPLILFILLGKWMDRKYHTHFIVIIGILLALTVSVVGIWRKILDYKKLMK